MTDKQIIAKVRQLYRLEKPLNITAVKRHSPELMEAVYAIKPYLGWKGALEKAGISYDDIEEEILDYCVCQICEKTYSSLYTHFQLIHEWTTEDYQKGYPGADMMSETLRAKRLGCEVHKVTIPHWERLWSWEYCLDRLDAYHEQDYALNNAAMQETDLSLVQAIRRYGGKWDATIESIGLDPGQTRKSPIFQLWSVERVREELKKRVEQGKEVNSKALSNEDSPLSNAVRKYFSSHEAAITSIGLDYQKIRKGYSKQECENFLSELRALKPLYGQQRIKAMWALDKKYGSLIRSNRFGSFKKAAKLAGIPEVTVSPSYFPRKRDVLEELQQWLESGQTMVCFTQKNQPLRIGICKWYGTVEDLCRAIVNDPQWKNLSYLLGQARHRE